MATSDGLCGASNRAWHEHDLDILSLPRDDHFTSIKTMPVVVLDTAPLKYDASTRSRQASFLLFG